MTKIRAVFVISLLVAASAEAERQPFERYQSIVDRQMFGPIPPGFDPTKMPSEQKTLASEKELTQEQEKLQSAVHFSMINVTPEGATEVGFTDNSDPKVPVHYLLKVGETRNGWLVKEADPVAAKMVIAKGDIEISLSLGGNSAKDANATARAGTSAANPIGPAPGMRSSLGSTLRSRRLLRQQAVAANAEKEKAEREAREAEQRERAEQERAQREAERAEQRQQLQAIQEELKRVRENSAAGKEAPEKAEGESNEGN